MDKSRKVKTAATQVKQLSAADEVVLDEHLETACSESLSVTDILCLPISCKNLQQILEESLQVATVAGSSTVSKQTVRCTNFVSTLLRLAREEHPELAAEIQSLVQDLVDAKLEPEAFTTKLQEELDCSSSKTDLVLPLIQVSSIYLFIFKITRAMFRIYTGKYFSFATIIIHWRIDDRRHSTAFFVIVISICCYVDY